MKLPSIRKNTVVVIPNHNGALYIKRVLDKLCEQYPKTPIYVYDDASKDDSLEIVMGYRCFRKLQRLQVFHSGIRRGFDSTVFRLKELAQEDGYDKFIVINLYDIIYHDKERKREVCSL